ncbi:UDP-N-acetylmuramoyl-L-alanyl-D-glutamate--2,6-diaminopimelate ligase [Campylobacter sp. RM13119]|uniref:UDP-N-acetylmuramoyl-L-alanyl-D-glutamate--2, 6-diaminopimelate ligase n=1 Tax=Campylobacter californiensis TaxID=1032243 RepID=UPI00147599A1|nr:UDP-N-acetylmuramoyl-L-alanyl-D-glutamate--2,6-diaminopimelate ligase [Campylobacter sp. RM13119]MBE3606730.1 UDP-N-acetylmuramoyl-L-alanyl-D-glutamate--2,6-diaminopimelate ligase [Campylobacter sp. RM13119]
MKISLANSYVTDNSNECESGCFFVLTKSNAKFKESAQSNGAKIISVDECKKLLGIDENIKIIGITGTNGKTTTAWAIYETLMQLGYKSALSGTCGAFLHSKRIDAKSLTTSPVLQTLEYLKQANEFGCKYFVMEVSSHAIDQDRVEGLKFAIKIFTNLTQDHLDYHKSMQEYAKVKSKFLSDDSLKLINIDDEGGIEFNPINSYTYSLKKDSDFASLKYDLKDGIKALMKTPKGEFELASSLQGEFNLYNLTAAIGAILLLEDVKIPSLKEAIYKFKGVAGRMEVVSQKPLVIVDFAHTPDGMQKVLNALRHLNLIVIFGAGGDRDRTKRPKMGKIAQQYAKISIVTSDNPRSEEPETIIDEICAGMNMNNTVVLESDRKKAIKLGLDLLDKDDTLVILGKGDEDYQEINGVKHHFSDKETVLELLKI